ncbi:RnfH family protein [Haemophilus parahaemolyticus]|uniref:RnfH family protein n=1 Tax=Haemophilus parahaemolyticus TaxID=735 RepID=UPI002910F267|nr:RnfH family protein [Haemophilus parahaemolyticus]MDU4464787.1 RnfH family protein [Haemophilus parahaemolyticus]
MSEKIVVEVVYAYPERYFLKKLTLENPITIQKAIVQSGVLEKYTEIDLRQNKVGIFSRTTKLTDMVENGDRIEIYRPLIADPKEIRRKKAEEQAKIKKNENV